MLATSIVWMHGMMGNRCQPQSYWVGQDVTGWRKAGILILRAANNLTLTGTILGGGGVES